MNDVPTTVWCKEPMLTGVVSLQAWQSETDAAVCLSADTLEELIVQAQLVDEARTLWVECLVDWKGCQIIDIETTLEIGRWLIAQDRSFVLTAPLEPSALCLLDNLGVEQVCIRKNATVPDSFLYTQLAWCLNRFDYRIGIDDRGLTEGDRADLTQNGWIAQRLGVVR